MPPVYVLIGGRSERFGRDKATFAIDGRPWALHVAERLAGGGDATLVGRAADANAFAGTRVIEDAPAASGPIAGVLAALADRRRRLGEGRLVIASCDLVRPTREWVEPLVAALDANRSARLAAYHADGLWQPFPMVVETRCEPPGAARGGRNASLQRWLEDAEAVRVAWHGSGAAPPQANRPNELPDGSFAE